MRSNREIAAEALQRADIRTKKRVIRRKRIAVGSASLMLFLLVILPAADFLNHFEFQANTQGSVSAAEGSGIGGYMLVALFAFALGVIVTLLCTRKKE